MTSPGADGAALRRGDPPLVTGAAVYTDDLVPPGALHAVFVRAPLAHGRILPIDPAPAAGLPGVAGVFCAADLDLAPLPAGGAPGAMARPVLATDTVRFLGEAVAVVVAATRAQALDAAEAVEVDYEPLPVVTDPLAALDAGAPRLFAEGNLARERRWPEPSRALEGAEVVVRARFVNQRVTAAPLEPGATVAVPDRGGDALVLYTPARRPFWVRDTAWPSCWAWTPSGCGWSSRRSAGPSAPASPPTPSRSRWPPWPGGFAVPSATSTAARRPCWP
jgi:aerobic carbon-monoxide dehydrogenase large subunit